MLEKFGSVKNPLTIIALFAGIAEVSGTIVLPFLNEENQGLFVWFLMVFPMFLLVCFFLTLNFNPKVLYAPSDFKVESNFIDLFSKASIKDLEAKADSELSFDEDGSEISENVEISAKSSQLSNKKSLKFNTSPKQYQRLLESTALTVLSEEKELKIVQDVVLGEGETKVVVDGIAQSDTGNEFLIEVKRVRGLNHPVLLRSAVNQLLMAYIFLKEKSRSSARAMLVIIIDDPKIEDNVLEMAQNIVKHVPIKFDLVIFREDALTQANSSNHEHGTSTPLRYVAAHDV